MATLISSKPSGCFRAMINDKTSKQINDALEESMKINPTPLPQKEAQIRLLTRTFTESCYCGCGTQTDFGYTIRNLMEWIDKRNTATEKDIHDINHKVRLYLTQFEECFE